MELSNVERNLEKTFVVNACELYFDEDEDISDYDKKNVKFKLLDFYIMQRFSVHSGKTQRHCQQQTVLLFTSKLRILSGIHPQCPG